MTLPTESKLLSRAAQFLVIEIAHSYGQPVRSFGDWEPLYDAKIESITENINASPSECVFYLPGRRWNEDVNIYFADMIRVYGFDDNNNKVYLFVGYIVKKLRQFSGGTEKGGKYERLGFMAVDVRWLIASTCPIFGQISMGADDIERESWEPWGNSFTLFEGMHTVFNDDGLPNRDIDGIDMAGINQACFAAKMSSYCIPWNYGGIVEYILGPATLKNVEKYFTIDPESLFENNTRDWLDWLIIEKNISIEGLNPMTALQLICKKIGWAFTIKYSSKGEPTIALFKCGKPATKHTLCAPAAYDPASDNRDEIKVAVNAGKVMVSHAQFDEDISNVVNAPYVLAAPRRVEFTAELVPGWVDSDLVPDTADSNANLFFTEAQLETLENPSQYSFYKNYHTASAQCKRDVGRIFVLNETGKYTESETYDRGDRFELGDILPADMLKDEDGKLAYGYFDHVFLPCITQVLQNSVGILVQISYDGGSTWHIPSAAIVPLEKEAGIMITEANLSEIKPKPTAVIDGGDLDGVELNLWTSLAKDKLSGSACSSWQTRVKVTASIQLEKRLIKQMEPVYSGSPFYQADVIAASNNFVKQERHSSSVFSAANMPANEQDDYEEFTKYIDKLKKTLEDTSISGRILLERLWLNKFTVGDAIEKFEGRDYSFQTSLGEQDLYPEIVQITYWPQKQKMQLITRDLRFSENR
ncbi:MAG: hypothetical protein A2Y12_01670 [Planctomycetes bacterium GWF2_42_9]|nr:MAG: hypothetical protein A2Y12_01670 [Planctomycetes bacterium GWF2_42_9]HAL45679.1 hypothetical protein [Phycisphaerales bacterium]